MPSGVRRQSLDAVDRRRRGDEHIGVLDAAEAQIRCLLGQENRAEETSIGVEHVDLGDRTSGKAHTIVKCPISWVPSFINGGHGVEWAPEISTPVSLGVIVVSMVVAVLASVIKLRVDARRPVA